MKRRNQNNRTQGEENREQRQAQFERLQEENARLIVEGFDHPPLDTVVLAMPISWRGTLQQYAGRLHREHTGKRDVRIYDYMEHDHPQLDRMWEKRQRGYRAMGYIVKNQR